MPRLTGELGPLERATMEFVWDRVGDVTVRDVLEIRAMRGLAYTTVMTVLDRLWRKGYLAREKVGRAYAYRATRTREEHVAGLVDQVLAGARDRSRVLLGFVRGVGEDDLAELRRLIAKVQRERKTSPSR